MVKWIMTIIILQHLKTMVEAAESHTFVTISKNQEPCSIRITMTDLYELKWSWKMQIFMVDIVRSLKIQKETKCHMGDPQSKC